MINAKKEKGFNILVNKYDSIIRKVINKFTTETGFFKKDELYSEALLCLYSLHKKYPNSDDKEFKKILWNSLKNKFIDTYRKHHAIKNVHSKTVDLYVISPYEEDKTNIDLMISNLKLSSRKLHNSRILTEFHFQDLNTIIENFRKVLTPTENNLFEQIISPCKEVLKICNEHPEVKTSDITNHALSIYFNQSINTISTIKRRIKKKLNIFLAA